MLVDNKKFNKVRSKIIAMIEKREIPSMAVAVAQEGDILWEEAFGWANQDEQVKATPHTIYPIASLSKSLAATGIMILAERKQLSLDDPVERYIAPAKLTVYEGQRSEVTIRRVLNMTAGIPHGCEVYGDSFELPILHRFVSRYGIVVFPPGAMELYSNFSYSIPELIIENVSGKSFANFMKTEVFVPLGMTHTSVGVEHTLEVHAAIKYDSEKNVVPDNYFVPAAAGGIYSSAHDLIQFGMFHLKNHLSHQKQILKDETLAVMHMDKDKSLPSASMALGWGSVDLGNGYFWILSNGGIEGATSILSLELSANLAVVCLTNVTSRSRITDQIAIEIADNLQPKFANKVETFMTYFESANAYISYKPTSQLIGRWEGAIRTQESAIPIRMVFHDNGKANVSLDQQRERLLRNVSVRNEELKGSFKGILRNERGFDNEHTISIHVKVTKDKMHGVATAEFETDHFFLMLPSYVSLNKCKNAKQQQLGERA